jgi:hypothetical protein
MPIIPKSKFDFRLPPRCPLDNVSFVQLRKFMNHPELLSEMGDGYDLIEVGCRERKRL